jgi:hypothetical protein
MKQLFFLIMMICSIAISAQKTKQNQTTGVGFNPTASLGWHNDTAKITVAFNNGTFDSAAYAVRRYYVNRKLIPLNLSVVMFRADHSIIKPEDVYNVYDK